MTHLTRRKFLASTAGAAALGLSGSLAFSASAQADALRDKGFYTYKIGDVEVISIYDGVWQNDAFDGIAKDVPESDVKAALSKAGQPVNFIPIEFVVTVLRTGGKTILLDAGTGDQVTPTAGNARRHGFAAAGIKPEDVDQIVISHMHPDHIFGLMEKGTNAQIFPQAEIVVNETEYNFWTDPAIIGKLPERRKGLANRIQATFPNWENVSLFNGDKDLAPGLRAIGSPGHSPGHISFHISSGDDRLLLINDAIIVPSLFLANLDWQLNFDFDKDQATATRLAIVSEAVADNLTVGGYHFGFPNIGKIEKDGSGHIFVPAEV